MSTETTAETTLTTSVTVNAPIERAFTVYTEEMQSWWPEDHHVLRAELSEMRIELRVGGRIYDVGVDGSECQWARVLAYEPPTRFVFSWDITPSFSIEPDPAKASEVEVSFLAESDSVTRVTLTHRHLDRHGDGWEQMAAAVGSPDGWARGMAKYAWAAAAA